MKVIVNYLDGSRKVYENCDDIDVDSDYIDIYTDPAGDDEPCIGLDLNLVKTVFTETILLMAESMLTECISIKDL